MSLIPGICIQCGAVLSVPSEKDMMECPYCNTNFIAEKAIHKFNVSYCVTNNINEKNIVIESKKNFPYVGERISFEKRAKEILNKKEKNQRRLTEDAAFNDLVDFYKNVIETTVLDYLEHLTDNKIANRKYRINFSYPWLCGRWGYRFISDSYDLT